MDRDATADTDDPPPATSAGHVRLRLLSTTDLHAAVLPFDYLRDKPTAPRGLAHLAPMIAAARAEAPLHLLCDTGDMLQGSALADMAAEDHARDGDTGRAAGPHPVIAAMNALGYDAAALGNHDFEHGLGLLDAAIRDAGFPCLCANIAPRDAPGDPARGTALVRRAPPGGPPITVGLIGVAPPQTTCWNAPVLGPGYRAADIVETVQARVAHLRAAGADVVAVLCHSGLGDATAAQAGAENAAGFVARLPGVDAVLAGHSHERHAIPGGPGAAPIVMAGAQGETLGVVDLDLVRTDAGWRVVAGQTALRRVTEATTPPDPDLARLARPAHVRARRRMSRRAGPLDHRLHGLFPFTADPPARRFVAAAQAWRARALIAGTPLADLPLLSAAALFETGGPGGPEAFLDLPPGALRRRDLFRLYPFANPLVVVEIDGATLRGWLEGVAALLPGATRGGPPADLGALDAPGYGFDAIYGVQSTLDLSRPAGQRVVTLRRDGAPVTAAHRFAVATNTYRAHGGGNHLAPHRGRRSLCMPEPLQETLAAYAAAGAPPALPPGPVLTLAPAGARLLLSSAPHATAADHDGPGRIAALRHDAQGFSRFELTL